jgi:hypothetical protein
VTGRAAPAVVAARAGWDGDLEFLLGLHPCRVAVSVVKRSRPGLVAEARGKPRIRAGQPASDTARGGQS